MCVAQTEAATSSAEAVSSIVWAPFFEPKANPAPAAATE